MNLNRKLGFFLFSIMVLVEISVFGQTLVIDRSSITVNSDAQNKTFNIKSDQSWIVTSDEDWLTIIDNSTGTGDATVKLHVEENTSTGPRNATVTVTTGSLTETLLFTQLGRALYLIVSTNSMTFSAAANSQSFNIKSNTSWTVAKSSADWLTISPDTGSNDGTITVTVTENTGNSDRTATVTVTWSGGIETIQITQYKPGPYLSISTNSMTFSATGNTQSISVGSNTSWTVAVTGGDGWLTVTPPSGSNDGTISVTAKENTSTDERTATITVTWKDATNTTRTETVQVKQAAPGPYLSISTNRMTFSATGNTQSITVNSNTTWTVAITGGDDWLIVSPLKGNNDGTISVSTSENIDEQSRSATITVIWVDGGNTVRYENIIITQNKPGDHLSVGNNTMQFSAAGNELDFKIISNTSWMLSIEYSGEFIDWLSVAPNDGINDGIVKVTAIENTGSNRYATIIVTWSGGQERINVSQNRPGEFLSLNTSSLSFNSDPDRSLFFNIESNTKWEVLTDGADWLSINPTFGEFDKIIEVSAVKNDTGQEREAKIYVKWSGGTEEITVKQSNTLEQFEVTEPNSLVFSNSRSTLYFGVQYGSVSWEVVIEDTTWLSANPRISDDKAVSAMVTLTAEENPDVKPRKTIVLFKQTSGKMGKVFTYVLTQKGKAMLELKRENTNIENTDIQIAVAETSLSFDVVSNTTGWKAKTDVPWIEIVQNTGDGNGSFQVHAKFNNTYTDRQGKVLVEYYDDLDTLAFKYFYILQDRCPVVPEKMELENLDASVGIESTIDDTVTLKLNTADYDNKDKWMYKWTVKVGNEIQKLDCDSTNVLQYGSFTQKKKHEVSVSISYRDDPDNALLKQTLSFNLYPSPKTPAKLIKKGDGSSGIMIAEMDTNKVNDKTLSDDGYIFVFGYDDDKVAGETAKRYYQYEDKTLNDSKIPKWVYTKWIIEDRTIYSKDTCRTIINNADNTKATTTVEAITQNQIVLNEGRLTGHIDKPASAYINVISMSGSIVRRIMLESRSEFNELLDLDGLSPGIYMIRCIVGEQSVEQKTVIK